MTTTKGNAMLMVCALMLWVLVSVPAIAQLNKTQQVLVTNSAAQPVPTTAQGTTQIAGTVSIGNAPDVNVTNTPNVNISNMPSVTISNTPSVNVANTPTVTLAQGATIAVTNPLDGLNKPIPLAAVDASQPYEDSCRLAPVRDVLSCAFTMIPAGKRLVLQEFDMSFGIDSGVRPLAVIISYLSFTHYFTSAYMGSAGFDAFATHQETRLYIDSNATPSCATLLSAFLQGGSGSCQISGFLVDVP